MALPANQQEIVNKLVLKVFENPEEGEKLAREYNLWDYIKEAIRKPLWIALCRTDVNAFIEYVIEDPETKSYAIQQPFHIEWQRLFSLKKRVMIVSPRGHGKTSQLVGRCIWEIGRNHNIRIKVVSATDDKAKEILGQIKEMIKKSERVKDVFPDLEVDEERGDTKGEFFVKRSNVTMRDGTVQSAGVLSSGAGGRADILLCDDVVDPKNALVNPSVREQVKEVLTKTWFSLVAASGRIYYLATPYHVQDATHHLRDTVGDAWEIAPWIPAIIYELQFDEDGAPVLEPDPETGKERQKVVKRYLWPEKWNDEALELKRTELGPQGFASQFLLKAMSEEDRVFPEESLRRSYNPDLSEIGEDIEDDWATFGGVDLASSLGKRAAWTVILTLARNPVNGRLRVKSIVRRKMNFTKTLPFIVSEFKQHKWRAAYVESNQYQTAVIAALDESNKSIPIKGFQTGVNKNDALVGLPGLNVAFDHGLFEIPSARFPLAPDDTTELGILMAELQTYPGGDSKDVIMALWFAYRCAVENIGDFEDAYTDAVNIA